MHALSTLLEIPIGTLSGGTNVKHDANTYCIGLWLMIAIWFWYKLGFSCFKSCFRRYFLIKDLKTLLN